MAQIVNITPTGVFSENFNLVSTGSEIIVLDNIPCFGFRNYGLTIFNHKASANSIATVKLYGSTDKVNYKTITISWSSTTADTIGHVEGTASYRYLRVTVTEAATFDVYLDVTV